MQEEFKCLDSGKVGELEQMCLEQEADWGMQCDKNSNICLEHIDMESVRYEDCDVESWWSYG